MFQDTLGHIQDFKNEWGEVGLANALHGKSSCFATWYGVLHAHDIDG